MNIVVLTGSPHKNGTSALLAERFIAGAEDAGHQIERFDAAFEKVNYCLGCGHCERTGTCVHKDAMKELQPKLTEADMIVFCTPLYYHDVPAQLKAVVDRFYCIDSALRACAKRTALLVTAHESGEWVMRPILAHYETTIGYFGWQDCGKLLALGCGTREAIEASSYPDAAYRLGLSL